MESRERFDALVIGAGMSGLAAAIRLAQFDLSVCLLEKHTLWGGLNSFYKLGGRRFDVGLHALTNYVPKGKRGHPLTRLLRQLRLSHDDFKLAEQRYSEVAFPSERMRFSNDQELFFSEIERAFPSSVDDFQRLLKEIETFDAFDASIEIEGARVVLSRYLKEPLLIEMLLLPTCYYGSAIEDDIDWYQFVIIFKAVFLEGFSRPEGGIRTILEVLRARYKELGGTLRTKSGVERITIENGSATGVVLESGETVKADRILSSAGYVETSRMCGDAVQAPAPEATGKISFVEMVSVLDCMPGDIGYDATVTFYSASDKLCYRAPTEDRIDAGTGVICSPNNYQNTTPIPEGMMRATILADYDRWAALEQDAYEQAKLDDYERAHDVISRIVPDPRPHTVFKDIFTPRTIKHFTGHLNGAVYGSRIKKRDGSIGVGNLHLCGTDQGLLGIVGSMLSGIMMANEHVLVPGGN